MGRPRRGSLHIDGEPYAHALGVGDFVSLIGKLYQALGVRSLRWVFFSGMPASSTARSPRRAGYLVLLGPVFAFGFMGLCMQFGLTLFVYVESR
jgi:hypothetical protein